MRVEAYQRAIKLYDRNPGRYSGEVVLIRALDEPVFPGYREQRDGGFGALVDGRVEIWEVSGDHIGIMDVPHVATLAAKLRPRLQAARSRLHGLPAVS